MKVPSIAVIIPCFNEETTISSVIESVWVRVPRATIIVVDNASTDNTLEVAKRMGALVMRQPRRGKGNAFRLAISAMSADIFFMVDGDNTYGIENLVSAIEMIASGEIDMVVGTRVPANPYVEFRTGHSFGNRLFTRINKTVFHEQIEDSLSGFRVMSSGFVKSFLGGQSGFELEVELNRHARILDCNIGTVTSLISARPEGSVSKLSTLTDGISILKRVLQMFKEERPLLSFSVLAFPWFITSVLSIKNVLESYFELREIANFPTLIGGVGCFIVSLSLWSSGMIISKVQLIRKDQMIFAYRAHQSRLLQDSQSTK